MAKLIPLSNPSLLSNLSGATVALIGNPFNLQHRPQARPLWTLVNPERNLIGLDLSAPQGIKQEFWGVKTRAGQLYARSTRDGEFMDQHEIFGDGAVKNRWDSVGKIIIYDFENTDLPSNTE